MQGDREQSVSTSLGTHNTYHTKHKEGPLLLYIVPQVLLPSSVLHGGNRKVQDAKYLEIISFTGFIKQFLPLISLSIHYTFGFIRILAT